MSEINLGALVTLIALIFAGAYITYRDNSSFASFAVLTESSARRRVLRQWTTRSFIVFGVLSVGALALFGRLDAIITLPADFAAAKEIAAKRINPDTIPEETSTLFWVAFGLGVLFAITASVFLRQFLFRKKNTTDKTNDIESLQARNWRETIETTVLSINAGVTEELYFRLALPLIATIAIGDSVIAFTGSCVLFGLMHYYQGWFGVLRTMLVGFGFAAVYLAFGNLLILILIHAAIDIVATTLVPIMLGKLREPSSAPR